MIRERRAGQEDILEEVASGRRENMGRQSRRQGWSRKGGPAAGRSAEAGKKAR